MRAIVCAILALVFSILTHTTYSAINPIIPDDTDVKFFLACATVTILFTVAAIILGIAGL